ncbi:aminotransferase class V-fold PLP-dependent enzyme [Hydrogenophaga sp. OTU3427]|uniref:aminotransferase class V-fold PLP-dependent enzyme n=1 Tax=Hydrogenophaga sp. OTU3427 TaxID=3043856 RepID=UPI00313E0E50
MDNASVAPMPRTVEQTSLHAVSSKSQPWLRDREAAHALVGELRSRAAALVNAQAHDMAITCAVSYGLATARANLPVRAGERILVLEGDHTSQMLTWQTHAQACGAQLDTVTRPVDGNWTRAIEEHLCNGDQRPIAIASLCDTFWIDGSRVDLQMASAALRERGASIVLDLTQSVGVLDSDVQSLDPDFVVFPMYKWLLGPYSMAFLYVAPRWQQGRPLEQNIFNRASDGDYAIGAARFDMGERDSFVGVPTALSALTLGAAWSRNELRTHLAHLTGQIADRLIDAGFDCVPVAQRSPHILGVRGVPEGVVAACREQSVYFTQRHGSVRISPHVFNTSVDADRLVTALIGACHAVR